ncbi:MAG: mandelate racemase/muconate lactonizing enzyme family protein [Chloroflexi bacterium]|nr:mandelate racemase/muconate lactonizing enzyme family protein [Chloroflexota bacterium]
MRVATRRIYIFDLASGAGTLKITDIEVIKWHPGAGKNFIYIKLSTDAGITGWGESYSQADRDTQIEAHVEQLARYLIGRDPFHIRHFMHVAHEDFATKRSAMDLHCALSGIEIAMWDIVGKATEQPIYNLIGGPVRPTIRVYANGWASGSADDIAQKAATLTEERGFNALKFDPFTGPWREYVNREELTEAAATVGKVREAVGPDVELLVEVHRRLAPMNAIRMAKSIEKYNPYWFEEPCPPDNIDAIKEVKENTTIPVVTGEAHYTRNDFREIFDKRAADIINPDICNTGGILEISQIAAMAQPHYIGVSPHGYNSTSIGLAAGVHASANMPNFLIYEYFVNVEEVCSSFTSGYLEPHNSYIELPTAPGLGVEIDEAKLSQHPYKPFPPRNIRTVEDERQWH